MVLLVTLKGFWLGAKVWVLGGNCLSRRIRQIGRNRWENRFEHPEIAVRPLHEAFGSRASSNYDADVEKHCQGGAIDGGGAAADGVTYRTDSERKEESKNEKMLKYDSADRISAKVAMDHPYFDSLDKSQF